MQLYKLVRDGKLLYFNTESLIFDVAEKLFEFYEGNVYKSREQIGRASCRERVSSPV